MNHEIQTRGEQSQQCEDGAVFCNDGLDTVFGSLGRRQLTEIGANDSSETELSDNNHILLPPPAYQSKWSMESSL